MSEKFYPEELETQEDQLTELFINKTVDKQAYDRQLVRIRGNREDLLGQLEQLRLSLGILLWKV